jgi:hypothetical protein
MYATRPRSASQSSRGSRRSNRSDQRNLQVPPTSLTPLQDRIFDACAATAAFFLYAQRNVILCLHHDTLAIDRRFERHREDVRWIEVDNHSEKGAGRLVVSYDASLTTIVWDLLTGEEVARFASYEDIQVASWMRNGNIAFGMLYNSIPQGIVILTFLIRQFSGQCHIVRAIDQRTYFIKNNIRSHNSAEPCVGLQNLCHWVRSKLELQSMMIILTLLRYMNGSILIAALQPSFTILHTLNTQRQPSPIVGLVWHGSSSKQKSDMLASQTMDGDLRVWSIPKGPIGDAPTVIRNFQQQGFDRIPGPCWFGWSKMGRIVQFIDGRVFGASVPPH